MSRPRADNTVYICYSAPETYRNPSRVKQFSIEEPLKSPLYEKKKRKVTDAEKNNEISFVRSSLCHTSYFYVTRSPAFYCNDVCDLSNLIRGVSDTVAATPCTPSHPRGRWKRGRANALLRQCSHVFSLQNTALLGRRLVAAGVYTRADRKYIVISL